MLQQHTCNTIYKNGAAHSDTQETDKQANTTNEMGQTELKPVHLQLGICRDNWTELLHMHIISVINSNLIVKYM